MNHAYPDDRPGRLNEMPTHEQLVEHLLNGAWESHSYRMCARSELTLDRTGEIRETYFESK